MSKRREYISKIVGYDKPSKKDIRKQPKTQQTSKGRRRATFEQAYARRTTSTSRARAMLLYGKSKPPEGYGGKKLPSPVVSVPSKGVKPPGGAMRRDIGTAGPTMSIKGQPAPKRKRSNSIRSQIERINRRRARNG